jgi:hypothetical protein
MPHDQGGEMSTRTLQDRYGVVWLVWQVLPGQQPGTRGYTDASVTEETAEGCLTFESECEKRRIRPIPPRWTEYSDDELRAMCRMASPVRGGSPGSGSSPDGHPHARTDV